MDAVVGGKQQNITVAVNYNYGVMTMLTTIAGYTGSYTSFQPMTARAVVFI